MSAESPRCGARLGWTTAPAVLAACLAASAWITLHSGAAARPAAHEIPCTAGDAPLGGQRAVCYRPADVALVRHLLPFPSVNPSAAVASLTGLRLSALRTVTVPSAGFTKTIGTVAFTYGSVPVELDPFHPPARSRPYVLVSERAGKLGGTVVEQMRDAVSDAHGEVRTYAGDWTRLGPLLPGRSTITIESNLSRAVVVKLGQRIEKAA